MNIDNRLKRITDFIPSDSYILDVGCDHAFLDIYLALNRKNVKLIASDINENPLKKAQETNYLYISYIKQQKKLQTLNLNQEDFLKQLKKLEKDYQEKKVQANSLDYKQQTKEMEVFQNGRTNFSKKQRNKQSRGTRSERSLRQI